VEVGGHTCRLEVEKQTGKKLLENHLEGSEIPEHLQRGVATLPGAILTRRHPHPHQVGSLPGGILTRWDPYQVASLPGGILTRRYPHQVASSP
ncbi:hypothetical protein JOQ06_000195, partial [Pogonophryne albipinna]